MSVSQKAAFEAGEPGGYVTRFRAYSPLTPTRRRYLRLASLLKALPIARGAIVRRTVQLGLTSGATGRIVEAFDRMLGARFSTTGESLGIWFPQRRTRNSLRLSTPKGNYGR
jgi:hypothetical protein